jgi:regulator of replication initiation timing
MPKLDSRLAETEKWVSELKSSLSSLISESDLIKLNLKNYQVSIL